MGTPSIAELLAHHGAAMATHDIDGVMSDYAEDAVLIDPSGVSHGTAAIRRSFSHLFSLDLPMTPPTQTFIEGDIAHLVWRAKVGRPGRQGAETLLIRAGKIIAQTVYEAQPAP